ncbi:MAG TPA: PQQ-binding-like beta-propeller repeat protein [Solirubrobacteraceae bacterium]|jgi:alcohol dehydrogenase (cytochrome c)
MYRVAACFLVAALVGVLSVSAAGDDSATWALPAASLSGARAASGPGLSAANVKDLGVDWRFAPPGPLERYGLFATTPLIDGDTVYVEDLRSNVFALNRATGKVLWVRRFNAINDGPNGLALEGDRIYGATDSAAFALSASTGQLLWKRALTSASQQFINVAPVAWKGLVFLGTVGYAPLGRGVIYALDAGTGGVRWRFDTVEHPWPHPLQAGGGGIWYPVSIDANGRLYAGTANPTPWGGSPRFPNGAAFPGPVPYTDSLVVLDARTGRLLWHDQVTPHDIRDYDLEATPILATIDGAPMVFGAGKAGLVVAWNRRTRRRVWSTPVGLHRNDAGPLPRRRVTVCPGLFGGVETPMAYAAGRLFVPDVDLCGWGSAIASQNVDSIDPASGRGQMVALDAATGRALWDRHLPSPDFGCAAVSNDVVFTSTYAGSVYALSAATGRILKSWKLPDGIIGCPAVAGDMLIVGAGIPEHPHDRPELVAFRLR